MYMHAFYTQWTIQWGTINSNNLTCKEPALNQLLVKLAKCCREKKVQEYYTNECRSSQPSQLSLTLQLDNNNRLLRLLLHCLFLANAKSPFILLVSKWKKPY